MRIFGLEIRRAKALKSGSFQLADNRGGWMNLIREPFAGAWQRNEEIRIDTALSYHAVYACITLIAADVGKLRPKLVKQDANGIWEETQSSAFSPVLRKPNRYQNHIQFKEWWVASKLINGNAYALKQRDERNVVSALYLLDPTRVRVLIAPDGAVYYDLSQDELAGVTEVDTVVPASEIIHDRMNCLFHPLVGVAPIFASALAAGIGLNIERNTSHFFANGSNPSGILTAPTNIDDAKAKTMKERWDQMYSGKNSGRVAVLGNDLKFQPLRMSSVDAQQIEHLKWTADTVCSAFHVPPFKIGIGQMPTYQNAEVLNQIYYSDCLQSHIESFELCMDEGLGLTEKKNGETLGVELDLDTLLRMDTATQVKTLSEGVRGGIFAPNEARRKVELKPLTGGDTVYLQHQDYSIEALHERDQNDPFAKPTPAAPATTPTAGSADVARMIDIRRRTRIRRVAAEKRKAA